MGDDTGRIRQFLLKHFSIIFPPGRNSSSSFFHWNLEEIQNKVDSFKLSHSLIDYGTKLSNYSIYFKSIFQDVLDNPYDPVGTYHTYIFVECSLMFSALKYMSYYVLLWRIIFWLISKLYLPCCINKKHFSCQLKW